jgi:hypothetical protein
MKIFTVAAFAWLAGFAWLSSCAAAAELVLADDTRHEAKWLGASPAGLVFEIDGQQKAFTAAEITRWGALPAQRGGGVALLADGGQLLGELRSVDRERLVIESPLLGQATVPLTQVRAVALASPATPAAADRLTARLLAYAHDRDALVLQNGDELAGTLLGVDGKEARIEAEVGATSVPLDQVLAIISNPALTAAARRDEPRMIVGLTDGSWFTAIAMSAPAGNGGEPVIDLRGVGDWQARVAVADVALLLPLGHGAAYLSDLEAQSYKHIPYLSLAWPFLSDRSATGGLLRQEGRVYPKGLGMHSASRVTYAIGPDDRFFRAEVALDASAGTRGSVAFRVFVDSEERFASGVVRGGDPPTPVSIDVRGGKRLSLLVDFAERGDELDHANWLSARLTR